MEIPKNELIKEEHEIDICDNGLNLIDFDVKVKIENDVLLGGDWYLQNNDLLREIDKCNICNENFIDSYSLFRHNLEHLEVILDKESIYVCDYCSAGYLEKQELFDHMIDKHKVVNKLTPNLDKRITKSNQQCTICKKVFTYNNWHSHMTNVHSKQSVKCKQCGGIFKCYRYLQRHIKHIHDGLKPNWVVNEECICDECGIKFNNNIALRMHIKNCHSARTYQCYTCKSVLKCKPYLMSHIRRVHYFDGLEHACSICKKKFKSPAYLKVHIKNSHNKPKKNNPDTPIED